MINIASAPSAFDPVSAPLPERCTDCASPERLPFQFDYAYQPIVDLATRSIYAHEALVRGPKGEGALSVLSQVTENNRYRFD